MENTKASYRRKSNPSAQIGISGTMGTYMHVYSVLRHTYSYSAVLAVRVWKKWLYFCKTYRLWLINDTIQEKRVDGVIAHVSSYHLSD